MNSFVPLNKYILIEEREKPLQKKSLVELPEDYLHSAETQYKGVKFIASASDCHPLYQQWKTATSAVILIVDASMIAEVIIGDSNYLIIHQNYVVGVMETAL